MRTRITVGLMAALLGVAAVAAGQPTVLPSRPLVPALGSIDLGIRATDVSGDAARFQRFRDIGDGAFLDRFRYAREHDRWFVDLGADHVGRSDQRYFGEFRFGGKVKAAFTWDQVPLFYSRDTRTLYSTAAPGVLRIDESIRRGIQGGQLSLSDVAGQARSFDTESRRDIAAFNLIYTPTRDLDVKVNLTTTRREGTQPFNASFGFSNAIEVPAPVDTRTTDMGVAVEWANRRGLFRVGYDGSWFDNRIPTLVWDNPWRLTDATNLGAVGQMALPPDSTLHAVTTAGAVTLPAQSRLSGHVAIGTWRQDAPLLPFAVNALLPAIPLPRATADAEARTLAMTYAFTSRPNRYVWLNARYRFYEFDNRTPHFDGRTFVRMDSVYSTGGRETEPYGYTRQDVDVDVSLTPIPFTALKVGYGRNLSDRTFRIFEQTTDNVIRASIDTTGSQWVTLRAIFERSSRDGSGFDEHPLELAAEQPDMRHFDLANRDRNRATALVQLTPVQAVGITASVAAGTDDYKDSGFGLRDNENRAYSLSFDLVPREEVTAGVAYTRETFAAAQHSRTASPGAQFTDPRRDWSIDSDDRVDTVTADLAFWKLIPRTDLQLAYSFTRSEATYVYGLAADTTLPVPQQLPPVRNELQSATADLRHFLTSTLAVGVTYWYDRYAVDDFALGGDTMSRIDLPGSLFLGYLYRPYRAHSAWLRVIYYW